jgi:DNA-binding LacI/PurR family transcriptional regulator
MGRTAVQMLLEKIDRPDARLPAAVVPYSRLLGETITRPS